jgi:hypothetical protein
MNSSGDMTRRAALRAGAALALTGALGMMTATAEAAVDTGKWRLYDAREGKDRPWRDLPTRLVEADAVFVGSSTTTRRRTARNWQSWRPCTGAIRTASRSPWR